MASSLNLEGTKISKVGENLQGDGIILHKSDHPWKPYFNCYEPHLQDTVRMSRQIRSILNRLTLGNHMVFVAHLLTSYVWDEDKMALFANMLFERAIGEPKYRTAYAKMCKELALMRVAATSNPDEAVQFRKLIINRCQKEFQKDNHHLLGRILQEQKSKMDDEEKLIKELEEAQTKASHRSLGNIRFIGELFKLGMLTVKIMHECLYKLICAGNEDTLECLCRLLTTIGKVLETSRSRRNEPNATQRMDNYINVLSKIVEERKTSPRVRFMIQDVCDLHKRHWVPLRPADMIDFSLMGNPIMNKDQLRRLCDSSIDAYLDHLEFQDVVQTVTTICSATTISHFLNVAMNRVFTTTSDNRLHIGQLLHHLLKMKVVSVKQFTDELSVILCTMVYQDVDTKMLDYLGEVVSHTMIDGTVSFRAFTDTLHPFVASGFAMTCITRVVHHLKKATSKSTVSEMWRDSLLILSKFLGQGKSTPPELQFLTITVKRNVSFSSTSTSTRARRSHLVPPKDEIIFTKFIPLKTLDGSDLVNLTPLYLELKDCDTNVPAIKSLLQAVIKDDRKIILIDRTFNKILDTEGTRGARFWAGNIHNLFCIFEDDYSKYLTYKDERSITASQYQVDDSVDMLQNSTSEIKIAKEAVTELTNCLPQRVLPITEANIDIIQNVLHCVICKGFIKQPVVASCCHSIVACKPCYDLWKNEQDTSNEIPSPQPPCPKCGLRSGTHFEVLGLAEISMILANHFQLKTGYSSWSQDTQPLKKMGNCPDNQ